MNNSGQDLVIVKMDQAKQALAEAKTIQQTKQILDVADAAETYARRQQLGEDVIAYAHAIRIEALRRLGTLIREGQDKGELAGQGRPEKPSNGEGLIPKTLSDLNITYKTSMIAQRLADLPQAQFEQLMEGTTTITQALRANRRNTNKSAWSLESVEHDLRVAFNKVISNAPPGSQHDIAELLRRLAEEVDEAARPERREAVWIARDELELHDAEPGAFKVFDPSGHPGDPPIASCKSTHQPWYRELTTRKPGVTALRRKQVEARLDDIEMGTLPTKRTFQTYWSVLWAIKDLPRTSRLGRGGPACDGEGTRM